jgi:hypothetical protein
MLAEDPRVAGQDRASVLALAADVAALHDLDEASRLITASRAIDLDASSRAASLRTGVESALLLLREDFIGARDMALAAGDDGPLGLTAVVAALGAAYADEPALACRLNERYDRSSPSRQAFYEYVLGEVAGRERRWAVAEHHYLASIELAGQAGATFVQRISSVGLASVRGRRGDAVTALLAYQDLLEYWDQNLAWSFQVTTVRNLAELLEQLSIGTPMDLRAEADRLQNSGSADVGEMQALVDVARDAITFGLAHLPS